MIPDLHLRELEAQLVGRPGPEPPAELRARLLGRTAELRQLRPSERRWRQRLAGLAAAVVVAVNLALCADNGRRYQGLAIIQHAPAPAQAERPATEDPFETLAAVALARLTPLPDAGDLARDLFRSKEALPWALP